MKEKKEELIKRIPIENTPFTIIWTEQEGAFVTLGKYRVSEPMPKIEDCKEWVHTKPWELIMAIIHLMAEESILQHEVKEHQVTVTTTKPKNNGTNR